MMVHDDKHSLAAWLFRLLAFAVVCCAAATSAAQAADTVRIGSKNFTEQEILAELVAQLIERHTDLRVERKFGLGGTGVCHAALVAGELDIYVEYTGTALLNVLKREVRTNADDVYQTVAKAYRERFELEWLPPMGFNNAHAITVRATHADEHGWQAISDLGNVADRLSAGFTAEFMERPDGYRKQAGIVEGEWNITIDVMRDLGLAFAAACLGIYVLLVYETKSYLMPLILMISIPLTIIGIMPGFWLLNALTAETVGSWQNPVFFTATAMIGMIALSGIAVRNAILLIEFVHKATGAGQSLKEALLVSGAVRLRPIFLTAGTAMLAAWPITLDPIFSGLAWALIFGLFVSTVFTLLMIPVVYYMVYGRRTT